MTAATEIAARHRHAIADPSQALADEQMPEWLHEQLAGDALTERDRAEAAFETGARDAFGSGWPLPA